MDGQAHSEGRKEKEREVGRKRRRQRECRTLYTVCGVKISNREGK